MEKKTSWCGLSLKLREFPPAQNVRLARIKDFTLGLLLADYINLITNTSFMEMRFTLVSPQVRNSITHGRISSTGMFAFIGSTQ